MVVMTLRHRSQGLETLDLTRLKNKCTNIDKEILIDDGSVLAKE